MECAKVLLTFSARVDVRNACKKTPLDLWRDPGISSEDMTPTTQLAPTYLMKGHESGKRPHFAVSECVDMEYAPDKARNEFVCILTSRGAQRGRDLTRSYRDSYPGIPMPFYKIPSQHAPVEAHPSLAERSCFSVH